MLDRALGLGIEICMAYPGEIELHSSRTRLSGGSSFGLGA